MLHGMLWAHFWSSRTTETNADNSGYHGLKAEIKSSCNLLQRFISLRNSVPWQTYRAFKNADNNLNEDRAGREQQSESLPWSYLQNSKRASKGKVDICWCGGVFQWAQKAKGNSYHDEWGRHYSPRNARSKLRPSQKRSRKSKAISTWKVKLGQWSIERNGLEWLLQVARWFSNNKVFKEDNRETVWKQVLDLRRGHEGCLRKFN